MSSLYSLFFAAVAVMVAINVSLARRFRSTLPLVYSLGLLAVGAIVYLQSLAASSGDLSVRLAIAVAGGAAAACLGAFWDRLMLLPVHAPRARWLMLAPVAVIVAASAIAVVTLLAGDEGPLSRELVDLLENAQQLAAVLLLPAIAATALPPLRAGYRPALYSVAGLLFFLARAAASGWVLRGFVELDGGGLSALTAGGDALLLVGLLGEFLGFVFSLSNRAELHTAGRSQSEAAGIQSYASEYAERRYARSKLGRIDTTRLQEQLRHYMESEQLYCDEDLSLDRLAELCDTGRHELSEYLNQRLGTNFNRYVNGYRVRAVQTAIREDPARTLLDIAFSAGFNSKTRFNSEFKRVTGQTPGEYRRQVRADSPGDGD